MKFKSKAHPEPYKGSDLGGKKITVPDQSMSLKEILQRFVRGEPVPVGRDVQYHESEDDLEKIAHEDLVDQAEFHEKQVETQKTYVREQKAREQKERDAVRARLEAEERDKLEKQARDRADKDSKLTP